MPTNRRRSIPHGHKHNRYVVDQLQPENRSLLTPIHWSNVEWEDLTIAPSEKHLSDKPYELLMFCRLKGESAKRNQLVLFDRAYAIARTSSFLRMRFMGLPKHELVGLAFEVVSYLHELDE